MATCLQVNAPAHSHKQALRARTHAKKYVIIIAFPLQQWFRERASVLRNTYVAFLVYHACNQVRLFFRIFQ